MVNDLLNLYQVKFKKKKEMDGRRKGMESLGF